MSELQSYDTVYEGDHMARVNSGNGDWYLKEDADKVIAALKSELAKAKAEVLKLEREVVDVGHEMMEMGERCE